MEKATHGQPEAGIPMGPTSSPPPGQSPYNQPPQYFQQAGQHPQQQQGISEMYSGSPGQHPPQNYTSPQHSYQGAPQPQGQYPQNPQQAYQSPGQPQYQQQIYQSQPAPQQQAQPQQQGQPQQAQTQTTPGQQQYQTAYPLQSLNMSPAPVDCPICHARKMTRTTPVTGNTTHAWAGITFCFTLCLCFIPYMISSLKDVQHRCGNCGAHLATWHRSGQVEVLAH